MEKDALFPLGCLSPDLRIIHRKFFNFSPMGSVQKIPFRAGFPYNKHTEKV